MSVLQKLGLAVLSLGASAVIAGESRPAPALTTGQRIVASFQVFHLTQVEYCLRNVPELREQLSLAYATYSVAVTQAAEILSKRFPSSKVIDAVHVTAANDERSKELLLRQIRSMGLEPCGSLVSYMHGATGESLAKMYGDNFASLVHQLEEPPQ